MVLYRISSESLPFDLTSRKTRWVGPLWETIPRPSAFFHTKAELQHSLNHSLHHHSCGVIFLENRQRGSRKKNGGGAKINFRCCQLLQCKVHNLKNSHIFVIKECCILAIFLIPFNFSPSAKSSSLKKI